MRKLPIMAMRRSHNLHTIYKAEVIEHPFLPEMGVDLTSANTIIYEMRKLCSYTNFGTLFPTVAIDFCFFTYILIFEIAKFVRQIQVPDVRRLTVFFIVYVIVFIKMNIQLSAGPSIFYSFKKETTAN